MKHFIKMKLQNDWGTFIDLKILPVSYFFYDVLSDIWVTLYGGMAGYTEYCRIRNIPVFDLNWTDKKAEAKNTRLFWNIQNSIFVLS